MNKIGSRDELQKVLEQLVDAKGLQMVVQELATTCQLKADHISENWQDKELAKAWDMLHLALIKVADKADDTGIV